MRVYLKLDNASQVELISNVSTPLDHNLLTGRDSFNAHDASAIGFRQEGEGAVESSVKKKLLAFVTPEDFGAVGDGVTDDTEAIQAALSSTHQHIHFPFTYYITSTLVSSLTERLITCSGKIVSNIPELKVLEVTGDKSEIQINIQSDGASVTDGVHIKGAAGCIVRDCRIEGMYSKEEASAAIRADTVDGVVIRDNHIKGVFDPANNPPEPGGPNAVSRAITLVGNAEARAASMIKGNYIDGSADPRFSAIQIIFQDGLGGLFPSAKCTIEGNNIFNFNRRAIKIQASGVTIKDNYIKSEIALAQLLQPSSAIDLQYCRDVNVTSNTVITNSIRAFAIQGSSDRKCEQCFIRDNYFETLNSEETSASSVFHAKGVIFTNNHIHGGGPGLVVGYIEDSVFSGTVFTGDGSGTGAASYCISHNNTSKTMFKDTYHISGNRTRVFLVGDINSTRNIYDGVYSNANLAILVNANSINNVVRNVISMNEKPPISGDRSGLRMGEAMSLLGSSQVGSIYFTNDIPTTSTPSLTYSRGDYALSLNSSPGTPMGWVCTSGGTPGTWRALANIPEL